MWNVITKNISTKAQSNIQQKYWKQRFYCENASYIFHALYIQDKLENSWITDLYLRKTWAGKLHDSWRHRLRKAPFSKRVRHQHWNAKPAFINSSSSKSAFEKLRFLNRLLRALDIIVEIKLCSLISLVYCGWGLKFHTRASIKRSLLTIRHIGYNKMAKINV